MDKYCSSDMNHDYKVTEPNSIMKPIKKSHGYSAPWVLFS